MKISFSFLSIKNAKKKNKIFWKQLLLASKFLKSFFQINSPQKFIFGVNTEIHILKCQDLYVLLVCVNLKNNKTEKHLQIQTLFVNYTDYFEN